MYHTSYSLKKLKIFLSILKKHQNHRKPGQCHMTNLALRKNHVTVLKSSHLVLRVNHVKPLKSSQILTLPFSRVIKNLLTFFFLP